MYARAAEMYGSALKEPLKEFSSYAALGQAIMDKEQRRFLDRQREAQEANPAAQGALKAGVESVFLEFARSTKMRAA